MIVTLDGLLRAGLEATPGPVFALSYGLPDAFQVYSGPLTFYGAAPPPQAPAGPFESVIDANDAQLLETLEQHAAERDRPPYRLVYLNHHRRMERIARAVNALRRWSDTETVWIFPGSAPPERAMTGPEPRHSWWVGETWLLPEVLEPAGPRFQVLTGRLAPLGVTLARDFGLLDLGALQAASAEAAVARPDTAGWRATLGRAPLQALEAMLEIGADRPAPPPGMVEVVVDPSDHDVRRSDLIQAEDVWERPPPAFILDLSEHGLDTRLLHEQQRSKQGAQVDHFGPVQVLGRDVVFAPGLTDDQRRFYCKNTRAKAALGSLGTAAQLNDPGDASTATLRDGERFLYPRERLETAEVLDAPVFLATPDEHLNWGMWLLYTVPTAVEYARYRSDYPRFLCATGEGWQRPLLLELGVPEDALTPHRMDRVLSVPALASYRQTFRGMVLRENDAAAFDAVGERFSAGEPPGPARIYVSRKRMRHYRVLTNEDELEAALEARGFVSVSPESLPFREQVRLFRQAEVVVGLGGAGMFNIAFCRPGVRVVTIESSMLWVDSHVNLIASRGATYGVVLGRQDPTDPTPDQKRWSLDVPRAVAAIDDLVAG